MKHIRLFRGVCAIAFGGVGFFAVAQDFSFDPVRPEIVSVRADGMGGYFAAEESGFDTLSTNPAALAYVDKEWSISRLAAEVSGPLFDIPTAISSGDVTENLLDLVGENNGIYLGANITGPLAFGKVDRNYGFGVFGRTITSADVPSLTSAKLLTGEELLLTGGYGLPVYESGLKSLAIGLQLKGFVQTFVYEDSTAITVLDDLMGINLQTLPAALSSGFGVDAGLMYRYGPGFSAGITCKDLFTPVFTTGYDSLNDFMKGDSSSDTITDLVDPYLNVGVGYDFPLPDTWITITDWRVMADYRDILDLTNPVYRNPLLNVAIGTEVVIFDVVSLRAGISDTYLATGLGVDLSIFEIDLAMWGSELGLDPGKRPLLNMALSLSFEY